MYRVRDRINVDGKIGTVRFVGHIPTWSDTALGIEWDDVSRGKNNGDINGVLYFSTEVPGSGSFIKSSSKKIEPQMTFMDAFANRYGLEANTAALGQTVHFGSKVVENFGFQKLNAIQELVLKLETLMLDKQNIGAVGKMSVFPSVRSLDLSYNLLNSWDEIAEIVQYFPILTELNVNGNKLSGVPCLPPLRELASADTNVTLAQMQQFVAERLNVSLNNLTSLCTLSESVKSLDLLFNSFSEIPDLQPSVEELHLANNNILDVPEVSNSHIRLLDLRFNDIESWDVIGRISDKFPNLNGLRIDGCPLFSTLSVEEMTLDVIARLRCGPPDSGVISKLNGSVLLADEITNAELYFMLRVRLGAVQFTDQKRWQELERKHGRFSTTDKKPVADESRVRLHIVGPDNKDVFSRVYLKNNTVLRLKGTICRHIQRRVLDFEIFHHVAGSPEILNDYTATLHSLGLVSEEKIHWKAAS